MSNFKLEISERIFKKLQAYRCQKNNCAIDLRNFYLHFLIYLTAYPYLILQNGNVQHALRRAVGVACGVGVARLLVARAVAVPAVVIVERRFLWLKYSLIWLRGRYHGLAAHDGPMRVETLAAGRYHGERAAHDGPVRVETLKRRLRSRAVAAST